MWTGRDQKALLCFLTLAALTVSGCSGEGGSSSEADAGPRQSKNRATHDGGAAAQPSGDGGAVGDGSAGRGDAAAVVTKRPAKVDNRPFEERFPLHGVALFHHVNVYSEPNSRSERAGVLRRGARVRVGPELEGRGCREGRWHPVAPVGYICSGRTMRIGEEPPHLAFTPTPPRMDAPTPYDYGRNRKTGIPLYRRPPRESEMVAEREYQAWLAAERARKAAGPPPDAGPMTPEEREEAEEAWEEERERRANTGPIAQRLKNGFYVTIERIVIENGLRWVRTSELNYVDARAIHKRRIPVINGAVLGDELTLPIAINNRSTRSRTIDERGRVKAGREIESYTPMPVLGEMQLGSTTYYTIGDNEIVDADRVIRINASDPPEGVGPNEKWIDVSLSSQTLVAYEGPRPVFATLVSTGKQGHRTPEGEFRITSKFISTNMSDAPEGDEPYLIEDVPWTMYFNLAIALHGAFWHSRFGRERSHGCVNLAPADARWLFMWVGPDLPEGWHGVTSTEENPGTRVFVHR